MTPRPTSREALLALPRALVLPDAARRRLERSFDLRPAGIVGIVAPLARLTPGASVTSAADWAATVAFEPLEADSATGHEVEGAILLEAGVVHDAGTETVVVGAEVAPSSLLVDAGARTFDPRSGPLEPAHPTAEGRPPFRWRPVVVLLAGEPDPERAAWAARVANELVGLDVEPRLALHDAVDGFQLTHPCLPDEATIDALRPDLVIALDAQAIELAERWSATNRATVIAELDPSLGEDVELVPWTIGVARGRLRARVGDLAGAETLARLINRLCSGPLPGAPTDEPATDPLGSRTPVGVALRSPGEDADPEAGTGSTGDPSRTSTTPSRRIHIVPRDPGPSTLLAVLVDRLHQEGHTFAPLATAGEQAGPDYDLVLVDMDPRRADDADPGAGFGPGATVVLVVDPAAGSDAPEGRATERPIPDLSDGARRAVTTSDPLARQLREAGIATMVLPSLPRCTAVHELGQAADNRVRPAAPTLGVLVEAPNDPSADSGTTRAIVAALDSIATSEPTLAVVVITPPGSFADAISTHGWAAPTAALPDSDEIAGWSGAIWVGSTEVADRRGTPAALVTLALAGVPVVVTEQDANHLGAVADRGLVVVGATSAASWVDRVAPLLDEGRRVPHGDRARRTAAALFGDGASALLVNRLLGWCDAGSNR